MANITLLGTYIAAGTFCLPAGAGCVAHGLPSTPEFATWMPRAATPTTIPILATMDVTALVFSASASIQGDGAAFFFHSGIR